MTRLLDSFPPEISREALCALAPAGTWHRDQESVFHTHRNCRLATGGTSMTSALFAVDLPTESLCPGCFFTTGFRMQPSLTPSFSASEQWEACVFQIALVRRLVMLGEALEEDNLHPSSVSAFRKDLAAVQELTLEPILAPWVGEVTARAAVLWEKACQNIYARFLVSHPDLTGCFTGEYEPVLFVFPLQDVRSLPPFFSLLLARQVAVKDGMLFSRVDTVLSDLLLGNLPGTLVPLAQVCPMPSPEVLETLVGLWTPGASLANLWEVASLV